MNIETKTFQDSCKKILAAVDTKSKDTSVGNEIQASLELKTENGNLYLNVTNGEYFVTVATPLEEQEELHAVVSAQTFLTLVSKITTERLILSVVGNALVVKANGTYKFPLIYTNDTLIELPRIKIANVTNEFAIDNSIIQSIVKYNSKELTKRESNSTTTLGLYYIDEFGAITFTSSACINNFKLEQPIKIVITDTIVKLLKLLKDSSVNFTLGFDDDGRGGIQSKVIFQDSSVSITAIIQADPRYVESFPVRAIRARGDNEHSYAVTANRDLLLDALSRIMVFHKETANNVTVKVTCSKEGFLIEDSAKNNSEFVPYVLETEQLTDSTYTFFLDVENFVLALSTGSTSFVTVNFGDHSAIVCKHECGITSVIPESARVE